MSLSGACRGPLPREPRSSQGGRLRAAGQVPGRNGGHRGDSGNCRGSRVPGAGPHMLAAPTSGRASQPATGSHGTHVFAFFTERKVNLGFCHLGFMLCQESDP